MNDLIKAAVRIKRAHRLGAKHEGYEVDALWIASVIGKLLYLIKASPMGENVGERIVSMDRIQSIIEEKP